MKKSPGAPQLHATRTPVPCFWTRPGFSLPFKAVAHEHIVQEMLAMTAWEAKYQPKMVHLKEFTSQSLVSRRPLWTATWQSFKGAHWTCSPRKLPEENSESPSKAPTRHCLHGHQCLNPPVLAFEGIFRNFQWYFFKCNYMREMQRMYQQWILL